MDAKHVASNSILGTQDSKPAIMTDAEVGEIHPNRRVFGNLRDEDPPALWESEEFSHFRDRLAAGDPDVPCVCCPKRFEDNQRREKPE
jgi:hypothetical protein